MLYCLVENSHSVISGSTPGLSFPTDDPRVSEAADVKIIFFVVVLAEELTGELCDPVH